MDTKLTLNLDKRVINKAKTYAKKQGRSLSDLIETYLKVLTSGEKIDEEELMSKISPEIRSLVGILKSKYPKDINYKDIVSDYLTEKYLK